MSDIKKDYYKAYDERYRQAYENGTLWELTERTSAVEDIIKEYGFSTKNNILDLGCGEGRDAIYLLKKGYNVTAVDYSYNVINKCNELTNNNFFNNFHQLDLISDELNIKYDFIYSIAVIHMFVLPEHRNKYWQFINEHLNKNGIAFVVSMGDGTNNFDSDINTSFDSVEGDNINTNEKIIVSATSCCIKTKEYLLNEIYNNDLECQKIWISEEIPNFDKCVCMIVKKNEGV